MSAEATAFYAGVAEHYDAMTRFEQRLGTEETLVRGILDRYPGASALDAACGTGLHAILLAKLGLNVVGADISAEMLERARKHGVRQGVMVRWMEASLQRIADVAQEPFDLILCLGNSLPHLLTEPDLASALGGFRRLLSPPGKAIVQILNYERILGLQDRIVGIHRQGDVEYIRFYDFLGELVQFNLLTVRHSEGGLVHNLHSTRLRPYRKRDLEPALKAAEFARIEWFGDLRFAPYDASSSPNLVAVAGD
jgi:SAM-dependent methyltransferase